MSFCAELRWGAALLTALTCAACDRGPTRVELEIVAAGEWVVLDRSHASALVAQLRAPRSSSTRARAGTTLVAVLRDTLTAPQLSPLRLPSTHGDLAITRATLGSDTFYFAPTGMPALLRAPAGARRYVFEHQDGIWLLAGEDVRKLTRDDDLDALRKLQREGEVILYWATAPVWSSDGELISFLTNRQGVRSRTASQGMWLVDARTGANHDLYSPLQVSVHTDGVLGPEFIFSSSAAPGVHGIDPHTRIVRPYSGGYLMGSHPGGHAILVKENETLILIRGNQRDTLPAPPTGHVYGSTAQFSPAGNRFATLSTNQRGSYTLHVFSEDLNPLSVAVPGGPSYGPVWVSNTALLISSARLREETKTYRARLR